LGLHLDLQTIRIKPNKIITESDSFVAGPTFTPHRISDTGHATTRNQHFFNSDVSSANKYVVLGLSILVYVSFMLSFDNDDDDHDDDGT